MRRFLLVAVLLWVSTARAEEPSRGDPMPLPELPPHDEDLGPVIQIEAIEIHGNTATQDEIIWRAMPVAVGDVLKASDNRLHDARFKILALGFFRDVELAMRKGSSHGLVIIDVTVVERGTLVLNKLWFGRSNITPYWLGADVGERNLFGLGISTGAGFIYAASSPIQGAREQWATEIRFADGSLRGTRWGANGSLTLVHGSDTYRVSGDDDDDDTDHFRGFGYRRFGGRFGVTYDVTALARITAQMRLESINSEIPTAPTRELPDGRIIPVDLRLQSGESRIATGGIGFDRDTRSDPILPHSGGRFTAALEVGTSALSSDYDFATLLARYEHWWPLHDHRRALGLRVAGGVVIGNAPRFDRIYIGDVNRMLTPRALGLILSNASPIDFLSTRDEKPTFGELGGIAMLEYAAQLYRGINARKRVYGGDFFFGTGLWGLAQTSDVQLRDTSVWRSLPIDLYIDMGVRVDTDYGIFELAFANALGRLR